MAVTPDHPISECIALAKKHEETGAAPVLNPDFAANVDGESQAVEPASSGTEAPVSPNTQQNLQYQNPDFL